MKKTLSALCILYFTAALSALPLYAANKKNLTNKKPTVTATIALIADAAREIGGDEITVISLMGAGTDPHLYKPTAGDFSRLEKADLILYNGLHLEAKMSDVLAKMAKKRKTVAVSESIPVAMRLPFADAEFDPHVWFDVSLWKYSVQSVYKSLCDLVPDKQSVFTARYEAYVKKLNELDAYIIQKTAELPKSKRVLISAHDAFNYFGKAYGFDVRGLQGVSTVTEASTKDMQELASFIAEHKIPAIFIESSVPEKNIKALQAAVKNRGYNVYIGGELFSDAPGDEGTFEGTYIGMLTHNINTITAALNK